MDTLKGVEKKVEVYKMCVCVSYLACSLACALVLHTIERVPGSQSRLWAACQRCRPDLETPHRSAGHLDATRSLDTRLQNSPLSRFFFGALAVTLHTSLSQLAECALRKERASQAAPRQPGRIACASVRIGILIIFKMAFIRTKKKKKHAVNA